MHILTHTHTHSKIQASSHSSTSHTCAPPHSVINRQTVPIWSLDGSQLCSSSVVKLLTPTGRETKRGAYQAAQQRGGLERRKEEVNRDKLNIRGAEEVSCLGGEAAWRRRRRESEEKTLQTTKHNIKISLWFSLEWEILGWIQKQNDFLFCAVCVRGR